MIEVVDICEESLCTDKVAYEARILRDNRGAVTKVCMSHLRKLVAAVAAARATGAVIHCGYVALDGRSQEQQALDVDELFGGG